jgi:hypothetical protein
MPKSEPIGVRPKGLRNLILTLVLISIQACTSVSDQSQTAPVTAEIGGQWSGISVASCIPFQTPSGRCNAQQKVTFSFVKNESGWSGSYSCAYGNMVCRNGNDLGQVASVTTSGTDFTLIRVQLSDGTSCLYKGIFQKTKVNGVYSCYGGAAVIEQGSWRASRDF